MSSLRSDVSEKLLKVYSNKTFKHTETINHGGTVIAFAMDENRRIYYAPLENKADDKKKGEFDAAFWPEEPHELNFPREIARVGFSLLGCTSIPDVHVVSKEEKERGEIEEADRDHFLSSTARFSALAPFQAFSDGKYVLVFRQAISSDHTDQLFQLEEGGVASKNSRESNQYVQAGDHKVPLVDKTLLCDRFVLVGGKLIKAREVRYRRSRHATSPASNTDALGATDMEGGKFYMPTQQLSFVQNLEGRPFSVLQLPTAISGCKRWQIMVHNGVSGRIDMFNMEISKDGLFNLKGSQLYTSPDTQYRNSVLERTPGKCPFTNQPLIPVTITSGHAETCMVVRDLAGHAGGTISSWTSTPFTIEAWVKSTLDPPSGHSNYGGFETGDTLFVSHTSTHPGRFMIELTSSGKWTFRHPGGNITEEFGVGYNHQAWVHLAVSYDGTKVRGYVDGTEKFSTSTTLTVHVGNFRIGADETGTKRFKGKVDEVRLWDRACVALQIKGESMIRLLGIEKGLVGYWTFDEGLGTTVTNQVAGGVELALSGGAKFTSSNCPIGANNGLRRDSFSISGRTISGGVSACYYFQQELVATGYDGVSKPMKKQARVLLVVGTTDTNGMNASLASLDVGISKYGRFAQFPDVVSLPNVVLPQSMLDRRRLRELDSEIEMAKMLRELMFILNLHPGVSERYRRTLDLFDALQTIGINMSPNLSYRMNQRILRKARDEIPPFV